MLYKGILISQSTCLIDFNIFFNKISYLKFEGNNIFSKVYQIDDINQNDVDAYILRLFYNQNHEESPSL